MPCCVERHMLYLRNAGVQQRPGELKCHVRACFGALGTRVSARKCATDGAVLASSAGPRTSRLSASLRQRRHANWPEPRAIASGEEGYLGYDRARRETQQPCGWPALVFTVLLASAAAVAVSAATWATSSIRLQTIDDFVGQWARHEPEHRLVGAIPVAAPLCSSAQFATFTNEFASLSQ